MRYYDVKTVWDWHKNRQRHDGARQRAQRDRTEQDREPRGRPTHLGSIIYDTGGKNAGCRRQPFQYVLPGKLESYRPKKESRTHPNSTHKRKLQMDERAKRETCWGPE